MEEGPGRGEKTGQIRNWVECKSLTASLSITHRVSKQKNRGLLFKVHQRASVGVRVNS